MCTIEDIVSYGKKYGYQYLGLVDHNVLAAAPAFKKACEQQGIRPVYGLEFAVRTPENTHNVIFYARDDEGFGKLMALSSRLCCSEEKFIDYQELDKYRDHNILCLLADDMPLAQIRNQDPEALFERQQKYFGKHIVGLVDHDIADNVVRDQLLKPFLRKKQVTMIALNRTFYLNRDDYENYDVLKCIRDKQILNERETIRDSGRHFLNKDEYDSLFAKEELLNCDVLAQGCRVKLAYETELPVYENKAGISSRDYLVSLCREGLRRRLKDQVTDEYLKRLDYELSVIVKMHFEDYFLIVYDFILYAKKKGIMVGPGRGSAAGSLVSYCLGITDIDPLKYGLIFERFLNPERISMPDIDTDFPDDRRDEVIGYVAERYGHDHVAHIITYGTLKARQVIRDVGRVLNYPLRDIDQICKLIPNMPGMSLDKAYEQIPMFKARIDGDPRFQRLFRISRCLEYFPRHESTHAAGIVLSRKPLSEVVPLIRIENDVDSTQYTMEYLEQYGLIKMDFLGLRNLGIIAEICADINREGSFDIRSIPLDDELTFKMIDEVNVLGIFQLESDGMRNLLRQMKPRTFEEIAVAIALFRPGPMKNIPLFLENRAHPEKISYLHPDLQPILQETYGIIVYQEQIINIARLMAGFSYGKADILRKAMSKKKLSELESLHADFIAGCMKNGYQEALAQEVYALILEFANYGFNKSHSIAYALVAYQLAYLKANYPLYFYKALLNGVTGSAVKTYDYISECLKINQKVRGISLNESQAEYIIKDQAIIMPFLLCKDVGRSSAAKIIEEREKRGPFRDYIDAVSRLSEAGVERNGILNLIYAGAFDEFGLTRNTMEKALDNVLMYAQAHSGEISLINDYDDAPLINQYHDDNMVLAENEKQVLGFYFTFNPLTYVKAKNDIHTPGLGRLALMRGNVQGFGLINRVKTHKTRNGEMMAFADLVDDTGALSLVIMPRLYGAHASELIKGKYVLFEGKIDKEASCLANSMRII